eukprot:1483559-Prymnesium_polylepis.1
MRASQMRDAVRQPACRSAHRSAGTRAHSPARCQRRSPSGSCLRAPVRSARRVRRPSVRCRLSERD